MSKSTRQKYEISTLINNKMENKEVKTESKVKKVAPHYMSVNPPKKHLTVVRPNYSQTKKEWSTNALILYPFFV